MGICCVIIFAILIFTAVHIHSISSWSFGNEVDKKFEENIEKELRPIRDRFINRTPNPNDMINHSKETDKRLEATEKKLENKPS